MDMGNNRRLRWACILCLLSVLLGVRAMQSSARPSHAPEGMQQVAIERIGNDVGTAVRQAVNLAGGLSGVIEPGDVVVVKINLVMDAPATSGIVTDPSVARAVVRMAQEAGARQVIIAEGTAQYREGDVNRDRYCTQAAFRVAGYDTDGDMIDDATGAPLADLNDSGGTDVADPAKVEKVIVPTGLIRKEYWLPKVILNADVLISVPVLKNHYLAGVTLGMKNLIGLLPNDLYHGPGNVYGKHSLSHSPIELDQHIVDVNLVRRPDFVVVDGQRGMIDGPIGSQLIEPPMRLILAGSDVVAVDTVGSLIMGYDPRAIPYLQLGAQSGLGTTDTGHIRVVGVPLSQARRDFPVPYVDSPARRAEAQPPKVAITAPKEEEWLGVRTVVIEANDDDTVVRIDLYLDDRELGQLLAPPYKFKLDTGKYEPGLHTLRAVAFDRSLNQAEFGREVYFALPTAIPTMTSSPVSNTVTLTPGTSPPIPATTPMLTATSNPTTTSVTPMAMSLPSNPPMRTTDASPIPVTMGAPMVPATGASPTLTSLRVAWTPDARTDVPLSTKIERTDSDQSSHSPGLLLIFSLILVLLLIGLFSLVAGLATRCRRG